MGQHPDSRLRAGERTGDPPMKPLPGLPAQSRTHLGHQTVTAHPDPQPSPATTRTCAVAVLEDSLGREHGVREQGVSDQSVEDLAAERPQDAGRLLTAGGHPDHRRDAPEVVELDGENPVISGPPDGLTLGVEEATADVPHGVAGHEGLVLRGNEREALEYLHRRAEATGTNTH